MPLGSSAGAPGRPDDAPNAAARRVLATLQRGAYTADQLARSLALSPQAVSAALTLLEIDGLIEAHPAAATACAAGRRRAGPPSRALPHPSRDNAAAP